MVSTNSKNNKYVATKDIPNDGIVSKQVKGMSVTKVNTFKEPPDARSGGGTFRKGELKGIIRINPKRCVGCDTCTKVCPSNAIAGELGVTHRIELDRCINCGQCLINCPFGAIEQMSFVDEVLSKLNDKNKTVVAIIAPAVRVALAEEFGYPPGTLTVNRMYRALKEAGFKIYDNNFAADQTILEEGTELIARIAYWLFGLKELEIEVWGTKAKFNLEHFEHKPLPQFTSCCPAWIRYVELYYPRLIPHLSSCKSPQQMAGATAKTYGALKVWNVKPENVYTVGIMPCTAKIFEASRPEMCNAWKWLKENGHIPENTPKFPDVDAVLTTRDLAELFRRLKINPVMGDDEEVRRPQEDFEYYSGGATIFGTSGGVMEAAIRTAYCVLAGKEPESWDFVEVRGYTKGVVKATIPIPLSSEFRKLTGADVFDLKVCVVNGIKNHIDAVVEDAIAGRSEFHFIEVMCCPGGCVNGGGQPVNPMGTSWIDPILPLPLKA